MSQASNFESMVVTHIQNRARSSTTITERSIEEAISEIASAMSALYPITEEDRVHVRDRLLARFLVTMDIGVSVATQHQPWLADARRSGQISDRYWARYRAFVAQSLGDAVIRSLDASTDRIVDFFGDPRSPAPFLRRGLVMGDVQSGKTANYIGLCCKAADAGYRLVILLTGTIEHLRKQTQDRLDKGFVGFETRTASVRGAAPRKLSGVGLVDAQPQVQVLTTTENDFSIQLAAQVAIQIDGAAVPTLLVTKKNQNNLKNIIEWISGSLPAQRKLQAPILVIDDEADNASVNTAAEEDPNRINRQIRELLGLSQKATYVGVTATPFANAFTRHDSYHAMVGDGLFPKEFIYSLDPPSNYLGAARLFGDLPGDEPANGYEFIPIDDAEDWLPLKHKISAEVSGLPNSLKAAVCRFVVSVAIRDIRGFEADKARAMMVNASRFTRVQNDIQARILEFVQALKADVEVYGGTAQLERLPSGQSLRAEYDAIVRHRARTNSNTTLPTWEQVRSELKHTLVDRRISVDAVNSNNAVGALTFLGGERRIVVGGNSLSRGITLDGLCVSYFHRKPLAKDTILQMGRWFGYRDGYADLCALYISDDSQAAFAEAVETSNELRELIVQMNELGQTPEYFGLRVLHHPGSLAITARNKMRHAKEIASTISLSGTLEETRRLSVADGAHNTATTERFCESLRELWKQDDNSTAIVARNVPKSQVADFIAEYRFHHQMFAFQPGPSGRSPAAEMIRSAQTSQRVEGHECVDMTCWDVAIVQGDEPAHDLPGIPFHIRPRKRTCTLAEGAKTLLVSGHRVRLCDRTDEAIGLDRLSRKELASEVSPKQVSGQQYRNLRSKKIGRPLLIVNFVRPIVEKHDGAGLPSLLVGLGLSFPYFDDLDKVNTIYYRVNTVAQSELNQQFLEDDADDE
jgi:hypothetical protein